jgi:hypothetical protein
MRSGSIWSYTNRVFILHQLLGGNVDLAGEPGRPPVQSDSAAQLLHNAALHHRRAEAPAMRLPVHPPKSTAGRGYHEATELARRASGCPS